MSPHLKLELPVVASRRLPEIDELKGVAILLVVLYHAGGTLVWANLLHGDLGVDMFVILSGIGLALGRPATGAREFFVRRFWRILPAYWIVLSAYWALNSHFLEKKYTALEVGLHYLGVHALFGDVYAMGINDSFWFITLILGLYVLYYALRKLLADPGKLLLAGSIISVSLAMLYFFTGQAGIFGHLALRLPGFFVGLLVGVLLKTGRLDLPLSGLLALALFIISYVPYTQGVVFHTFVVGALLMLFYVLFLRPALPAKARELTGSVLSFFGRYSLEIFLIHQPLIREYVYYGLGRFFQVNVPTPAQLIPGMLIGFALTLILSVELQRLLGRILPKAPPVGAS